MDKLTIIYPNGQMTFNVDYFFPCSVSVARKVFPFINKWISEDDFNALWDYLSVKYEYFLKMSEKGICPPEMSNGDTSLYNNKNLKRGYKKYEVLRIRCKRNIEILIGGYSL